MSSNPEHEQLLPPNEGGSWFGFGNDDAIRWEDRVALLKPFSGNMRLAKDVVPLYKEDAKNQKLIKVGEIPQNYKYDSTTGSVKLKGWFGKKVPIGGLFIRNSDIATNLGGKRTHRMSHKNKRSHKKHSSNRRTRKSKK